MLSGNDVVDLMREDRGALRQLTILTDILGATAYQLTRFKLRNEAELGRNCGENVAFEYFGPTRSDAMIEACVPIPPQLLWLNRFAARWVHLVKKETLCRLRST